MSVKKGKEFVFPDNVESGYNLIAGVTVKNFFLIVLPFLLLSIVIVIIPPYSLVLVMIRLFIGLLVATVGLSIAVAKPVKSRRNITVIQHLKFLKYYQGRQKRFYIKPKKRGWKNGKRE